RPHIIQTTPPLYSTGESYSSRQRITIWMNLGEEDKELNFGEGLIQISARYISDNMPYNRTGDFSAYFCTPEYIVSETKTIIILSNLAAPTPPPNMIITVTVGTGIIGANGIGMSAPVSFSYRTNEQEVSEVYKASNVWALHDTSNPQVESFFHQTAPLNRDRRLRKNSDGNYEVTLYFSASRNVAEIEEPEPDALVVAAIYYADLAGNEVKITDENEDYFVRKIYPSITLIEDNNSAGDNYRWQNTISNPLGVSYYEAVCTFEFNNEENNEDYEENNEDYENFNTNISGIYRLVALPYREGKTDPDEWRTAIAERRFVTVVIDNEAPSGSGNIILRGEQYFDRFIDNAYIFNSDDNELRIETNFSGINNSEGRILLSQATYNKPWTVDDQKNLKWRYSLVKDNVDLHSIDEWFPFETNPPPINLTDVLETTSNDIIEIYVQFVSTFGNKSEFKPMGRFVYGEKRIGSTIKDWTAVYDEQNNTITVNWTPCEDADTVDITVFIDGDQQEYVPYHKNDREHIISGVKSINASVSSGTLSGDFNRYDIIITPHPASMIGDVNVIICNVPGMSVSYTNPAIEITKLEDFEKIRIELGSTRGRNQQFILAPENDNFIQLPSTWTPIGTDKNSFQGKFYGNGKTIRSSPTSGVSCYGIFGYIDNAIIRDLVVEYTGSPNVGTATTTGEKYAGGIVGSMTGNNARIINCLVRSATPAVILTHTSQNGAVNIGGMVGRLNNGQIINSLAALNIKGMKGTGTQTMYIGGLVGYSSVDIQSAYAIGNVSADNNGQLYAGGLVGYTDGDIQNSFARGNVYADNNNNLHAGGLVGYFNNSSGRISDCDATGNVTTNSSSGEKHVGGLAGSLRTNAAGVYNSHATGKVEVTSTGSGFLAVGGLVGQYSSNSSGYIDDCYATGNVNVSTSHGGTSSDYGHVRIGGLVGFTRSFVRRSWAKGDVTFTQTADATTRIFGGGLIGTFGGHDGNTNRRLQNCYALGNVKVDYKYTRSSVIYCGGLIGGMEYYNPTIGSSQSIPLIENSFAKGTVEIKSDSTGHVAAGGIMGRTRNNVTNVVALGKSVISIKSGTSGNLYAYRIGERTSNNSVTNCRALSNMQVEWSRGGYNSNVNARPFTGTATNYDGADVTKAETKTAIFWTGATASGNMGWSTDIWDTTDVETRGYPLLKGFRPGVQE
ncbi:MAG: hypothetical protein FWD13_08935, partial [Treponema sp.]|nr:hypothetical protein [Treponema sp.]